MSVSETCRLLSSSWMGHRKSSAALQDCLWTHIFTAYDADHSSADQVLDPQMMSYWKGILRRFEVVFWCLEWQCCTFQKIDEDLFKSIMGLMHAVNNLAHPKCELLFYYRNFPSINVWYYDTNKRNLVYGIIFSCETQRKKKLTLQFNISYNFSKWFAAIQLTIFLLKLQYLVLLQTCTGNFHMIDRIQFMELIHRTHKQFQFIQALLSTICCFTMRLHVYIISHVLNA